MSFVLPPLRPTASITLDGKQEEVMDDITLSQRWSSNLPTSTPTPPTSYSKPTPTIPHISNTSTYNNPSLPATRSYSTPPLSRSPNNPRQRWSTAPTSTSSLSIVETIDYSTTDNKSPSVEEEENIYSNNSSNDNHNAETSTILSKRERSKAHFRGIMRGLFVWKEKEMISTTPITSTPPSPTPTKPRAAKVKETPKRDQVISKKEGGWNRFSVIIRPPKSIHEGEEEDEEFDMKVSARSLPPKRVDSGVDIRSTRSQDFTAQRQQQQAKRMSSISSTSTFSGTSSITLSSLRSSSVPASTNRSLSQSRYSTPSKPLNLTTKQKLDLLTQLHHLQTLINAQTSATEGFSKNLAGLLWEKHHSVEASKHLSSDPKLREEMLNTLKRVREQTAGVFMKKGVSLDRSLAAIATVITLIEDQDEEPLSSSRPPSLDSSSSSSSSTSGSTLSPRMELTTQTLHSLIQRLKTDLSAHSHLDPALRNTVVLPTQDRRFPATGNERLAMKRFVRFVDGRIRAMGKSYWDIGRAVREVEGWVDEFEE